MFAVFVALLYLSFVRRVSLWLEPFLPPEASAAILLFLPVVFFEPLQRLFGRMLQRTAQSEMDLTQRMIGPIQELARLGSLAKLVSFSERWIREQLQLAEVRLSIAEAGAGGAEDIPAASGSEEIFVIRQSNRFIGTLEVKAHGAMLSGETHAALEFLCEQLPGAIELSRLIEEKLQLERELAERERLALVGKTAERISHNLKNLLGQTTRSTGAMESGMPDSHRDVDRLRTKLGGFINLNQFQISRPAVRGSGVDAQTFAKRSIRSLGAPA